MRLSAPTTSRAVQRAPAIRAVRRVLPLTGLLGILAFAHAARAWLGPLDPLLAQWPRLCPLFALTGIRCPTCGLGRALIDAAAGDVAHAFHHHPLGPVLLAAAMITSLLFSVWPAPLRRAVSKTGHVFRQHPSLTAIMVAGYIIWGAARQLH